MKKNTPKIFNSVVDFKPKSTEACTKIQAKGNKTAEILLYEDIGEGWFGGISAKQFAQDLNAMGDIDSIDLRINSSGGSVFDGLAIYNILLKHKAVVNVYIDGVALSIASVIAMAGNTINMADNALFMIHNPWGQAIGTAKDLREKADLMDTVKESLVLTYAKKTNMAVNAIAQMMEDETWMNAQDAKKNGFIDNVTGAVMEKLAAHVDVKRFKNAPNDLTAVPEDSGKPNLAKMQVNAARLQRRILQISRERGK
jgi:ATP-dependent Clp protease, protease subunit